MGSDSERVLGLVIVTGVAIAAVYLLLRASRHSRPATRSDLALGYPAEHFPAYALTRTGPLAALARVQARLVAIYAQLPPESAIAVWLLAFLKELREVMNGAYRVVAINAAYGPPPELQHLVVEVEKSEQQITAYVTSHLLGGGGGEGFLDEQVAILRLCAQELGNVAPATPGFSKKE